MLRNNYRCIHSLSRLLQEQTASLSAHPTTSSSSSSLSSDPAPSVSKKMGRGKKKDPPPQQLTILNAVDSHLVRKKPRFVKSLTNDTNLDTSRVENQSRKLLNFRDNVSDSQVLKSIDYLRPSNTAISRKELKQIRKVLSTSYNKDQLKHYISEYYPEIRVPARHTKVSSIDKIINLAWKCSLSVDKNPKEDYLVERTFDVSWKEIFILLTENTFQAWMRRDVRIVVIPEEGKIMVKADEPTIGYIELEMNKIYRDIKEEDVDLTQINNIFLKTTDKLPIQDIQKITGVFFEEKPKDQLPAEQQNRQIFRMSSLSSDRIKHSKKLILWSLDYNPFREVHVHADFENPAYKLYTMTLGNTLPWIHRRKQWLRLKSPTVVDKVEEPKLLAVPKLFQDASQTLDIGDEATDSITTATFGQLLFDSSSIDSKKRSIFHTEIPYIQDKLLNLPLYDNSSEHSYFAQLKFVPSPYDNDSNYLSYPPLEIWIERDEHDQANLESLRVILLLNEQSSVVSIPESVSDINFVTTKTRYLVDSNSQLETSFNEQPGLQEFLENSNLNFTGKKLKIADSLNIKFKGAEGFIKYDYVNTLYRTELHLKYKERLLQFSSIQGGLLGGKTTEVSLIGNVGQGPMTQEEFADFTNDALEFLKDLKPKEPVRNEI